MTLDTSLLVGLGVGALIMWLLQWFLYSVLRSGEGDAHDDHTADELQAAQQELETLKHSHAAEVAGCEEKLADAEAELASLRVELEDAVAAAQSTADKDDDTAKMPAVNPPFLSDAPAAADELETMTDPDPPAPPEPDNLQKIEGIGPKIEQILNEAGITTFANLARTSVATLEKIVREDGGIKVAYPDTWPQQAGMAAAGNWDDLERLQDKLQGGRKA
ncbi:MAG: helix-hairpin-helix domain-containing protein [Ardenticatenaceae bacterium]|nr:helix-hairpin-helix domain-containing protein [Ardenticatenaceae bacterium]